MPIDEISVDATIVLNNIKAHNFLIQDYPMAEYEAKIVIKAIERYLDDLKFEKELIIH